MGGGDPAPAEQDACLVRNLRLCRGRRLRLRPRGLQAPGRVRQAQFPQSERRRPRQIRVRRFRQIEFPQVLRRCQDSVHLSEIETGEG
ncbi:hypothetical protein LINGRAHAP2_LOCUS3052 [Linum grandiflorum]